MTFDELKALTKKGKYPSKVVVDKIEKFILEEHRQEWYRGNKQPFFQYAKKVVELLEIKAYVNCSLTNTYKGFICNPANARKVYTGPNEETDFFFKDENLSFQDCWFSSEENKWYHNSIVVNWTTVTIRDEIFFDISRPIYIDYANVSWKAPKTKKCPHCSRNFLKSDLVFNDIEEDYVDIYCNQLINNFKNIPPKLDEPITGYHSHKTWRFIPKRKGIEKSTPMGIELEIHSTINNSQDGAKQAAKYILIESIKDYPNFYFEWDGSLSAGGFEMITNPMTLEYGREWWTMMLKRIRKVCTGYNVEKHLGEINEFESHNYGIHITIHRKNVPDSVIVKIGKFLDNEDNKELVQVIAQRHKMYGGYCLGNKQKPKAEGVFVFDKSKPGILVGVNRHQPINIKKNLIEFRMFRSTLNTVSFLKNMEFLDAIINYYKETLTNNIHHNGFLLWLYKNHKRYPNLITYLKHPVFFVKGVGKVKNVWLPTINTFKIKTHDPLKEYGPKIEEVDQVDVNESSMVGA